LYVEIGSVKSVRYCVSSPPIPSAPADLELIAQLKIRQQHAEMRIRLLEERLRLMRIEKKLSRAQMDSFPVEPVLTNTPSRGRE
jgi:hypothetical protein